MFQRVYALLYEQHRASLQFPNAHSDGIWSTFWTANDKILSGSVDEVAKAWCVLHSLLCTHPLSAHIEIRDVTQDSISVSQQYPGHVLGTISIVGNKSGTHAATSSLDSQIRVLNLESGVVDKTIDAGAGELWQLCYSPDETKLVSGSQQGKINLFDIESEKLASDITTQAKFVLSVAFVSRIAFFFSLSGCEMGCINCSCVYRVVSGRKAHCLRRL